MFRANTVVAMRSSGMFQRTAISLTPLSAYVKAHYDTVRHLPHKERLSALAKQYKELPEPDKARYVEQAAINKANKPPKDPSEKRAKKAKAPKKERKPRASPLGTFVKANYDSVRDLPHLERLSALSKRFSALSDAEKAEWKAKAEAAVAEKLKQQQ
eukprot:CAMPEP_0174874546 /NCGR_PEP_ID=MMETSP1114-20130205/76894_1 /TAXON_ID=312471 /ORGANISM="Neobodo designis, Strain CCAP 1951/1" /LENGTH=156 /DNA_ID=CAMNT_0016109881 /DNA_START=56 /DNA_END=526 /DNA_ORIENTATION=+